MESSRIESAGLYMLGEGAGEVTVKSRRWTITTRAGAADVREASSWRSLRVCRRVSARSCRMCRGLGRWLR